MTEIAKWCLLSITLPLLSLAIPGDPDKHVHCVSLARKGDCNFYDDCIEKWTQTCGNAGYALGYGGKYCRKFGNNQQLFNEAGQQWIDRVRLCLQDELIHSSVYAENSSCDQIDSFSYRTHPFCYVSNNFCSLVLMDNQNLNALFKTVTVRDLLWPFEATKAICDTLKLCYENEKYQYNNNSKGAEMCNEIETYQYNIPGFLTWIAQVAAEYPILSYLACVWYQ